MSETATTETSSTLRLFETTLRVIAKRTEDPGSALIARNDSLWIDWATTSLPVPVSPSMTTVVFVGDIFSMMA